MTIKELKTLKDMGHDNTKGDICNIEFHERQYTQSELKQEAIKWVNPKDWSAFWKWCREKKGFDYEDRQIHVARFIEAWIEYFFNLTEGDSEQ